MPIHLYFPENSTLGLGDPIAFRYREVDERRKSIANLHETLNNYMSQAASTDEMYSHIDEKDKQAVVEKVATIQKWLEDQNIRQSERPKNVDPVLTSAEIEKKRDELIYFAVPILTKPKPKPVATPGSGTQKLKEEGTQKEGSEAPPLLPKEEDKGPSEMDIN
jgi:heat shock protein 4